MKRASLHGRLRWLIIVVLAAVLLPLGMFSFQRTITEVDELSDGRLAQSARTLQALIGHADLHGLDSEDRLIPILDGQPGLSASRVFTYESEVGFQIFDKSNHLLMATANLASLPPPEAGEADFRDLNQNGYRWRVFTLHDPTRGMVIRTGERYDSRDDITHAQWLEHGLPLLVGLPLLALLTGWAVRRGLQPLQSLTRALSTREPGSRAPVRLDDAPQELQPVLDALNAQLARLEDALERERRFSADVAHELRTPLASVMINLENAEASTGPAEMNLALGSAQHGIAALARRIEQLLALARLEAGAASGQRSSIDLVTVAMDVIEELAPVIAENHVELSFARLSPQVFVQGNEAALAALLRNLLENAMRHAPTDSGQVQLSIEQGTQAAFIDVIDNGPGIPAERRAGVFARFHREAGSRGDGYGLGLSIVQRAAQLHDASIELLDSPYGNGLRVRVTIPLQPAA